MKHPPLAATLLWAVLVLTAPPCLALAGDRDQPMLIEADRAELDDVRGVSIYRGKVKVTQGSMVLAGDTITVYSKGSDVTRVVVEGSPATYRQRPDGKDKDVFAKARHMEYTRDPDKVILVGDAEVTQAGDVLRSDRIVYDITHDKVEAGGTESGQRVRITLQPKPKPSPKPEAESEPEPEPAGDAPAPAP